MKTKPVNLGHNLSIELSSKCYVIGLHPSEKSFIIKNICHRKLGVYLGLSVFKPNVFSCNLLVTMPRYHTVINQKIIMD